MDNASEWLIWLSVSVIVGGVFSFVSLMGLGRLLGVPNVWKTSSECGNDENMVPTWFSGLVVGVVERLFFTVVVGIGGLGTGAIPAMFIWTTVKAQTLYNIFPSQGNSPISRRAAYNALIAGLVSLLVAIICGSFIYHANVSSPINGLPQSNFPLSPQAGN